MSEKTSIEWTESTPNENPCLMVSSNVGLRQEGDFE